PGVLAREIRYQDQLEAPRREYFLAGTERELIARAQPERAAPAIRYPTDGMLVALDPDIPPGHQRLRFAAQGMARGSWLLDGKRLPPAPKETALPGIDIDWLPWPGRHTLALVDEKGREVDRLRFEVRGAVARPQVAAGRRD
ncbi:MAG: penicillin-binding protein 1C, partial [Burkholderiaceae bacterium]